MPEIVMPTLLSNDVVRLRAWRPADVPRKVMSFADPTVQKFSWSQTRRYTEDDAREFFLEQEASRRSGEELHFAFVEPNDDDRVIGGGSLYDISPETGRAAVGYWLIANARGHGYATQATRLMAGHAFHVLRTERLELTCDPDNDASRAVAGRCGFTYEGLLRSHTPFKGRRRDTAIFSLLPGELS